MSKLLLIKADTNDADYISSSNYVRDEVLEKLLPIFEIIASCNASYNWPRMNDDNDDDQVEDVYAGVLTEDQIDLFDSYRPYGEHGIHTIESIRVLEVVSDTEYL